MDKMKRITTIHESADVRGFDVIDGKVPMHDDLRAMTAYLVRFEEPVAPDKMIEVLRNLKVSFEMQGLEPREE